MKKVIITIILMLITVSSVAKAHNISADKDIIIALNILKQANQVETLDRLNRHKVYVEFYSLFNVNYLYYNYYAMTCTDELGSNYILINNTLKKSPHIALASLIAHESMHLLSATEEQAIKEEVRTWKLLRNQLGNVDREDVLVKRLEALLKKY